MDAIIKNLFTLAYQAVEGGEFEKADKFINLIFDALALKIFLSHGADNKQTGGDDDAEK